MQQTHIFPASNPFLSASSFFETEPEAKQLFGIKSPAKASGMQGMALLIHGKRLLDMIGGVVAMLGPDADAAEEYLAELGPRHEAYGVRANYFYAIGKVIPGVLKSLLADSWLPEMDKAWADVFSEIVLVITKSMKSAQDDSARDNIKGSYDALVDHKVAIRQSWSAQA